MKGLLELREFWIRPKLQYLSLGSVLQGFVSYLPYTEITFKPDGGWVFLADIITHSYFKVEITISAIRTFPQKQPRLLYVVHTSARYRLFCSTITHISLSLETKTSAKISLYFRIMNYHSDYCTSLKKKRKKKQILVINSFLKSGEDNG